MVSNRLVWVQMVVQYKNSHWFGSGIDGFRQNRKEEEEEESESCGGVEDVVVVKEGKLLFLLAMAATPVPTTSNVSPHVTATCPLMPLPSRRLMAASLLHLLAPIPRPCLAAAQPDFDYPPKSPLIQKLLEKSRANKTKNDQQRLDDYYERNYKDYFEFVEGTIRNKSELTETEKGILKWLERTRNKKK